MNGKAGNRPGSEKLCRSSGAAYRIRRNRQDPGGSHKRISQKYRLLKLFKKSQQDLPGFFFCIYGFFLRQGTEVIIQGLSDTGLFQIDTEKSIFFGKKAEKNGIVRQNFQMDPGFRKYGRLQDPAFSYPISVSRRCLRAFFVLLSEEGSDGRNKVRQGVRYGQISGSRSV